MTANEQNMDDTSWINDLPDAPELPEGPDDVVAIFMVKPKEEGKR